MAWDYDKAPTDPAHGGKMTVEQATARIAELEKACQLALKFWYSDHPNDTVEALDAHIFIRSVLGRAA